MSEHRARIDWKRESDDFSYESYNRSHSWSFENGVRVSASAAPAFRGDEERVDPEEAFVATIASCHMLTFLALAARKRLTVERYTDRAVGYLEKNEDGRLAITRVTLRPVVEFGAGSTPGADGLKKLHEMAHHGCFIANSVRTAIEVAD